MAFIRWRLDGEALTEGVRVYDDDRTLTSVTRLEPLVAAHGWPMANISDETATLNALMQRQGHLHNRPPAHKNTADPLQPILVAAANAGSVFQG